jgi:ABC-type transport system substrate-binding protein
MKLLLTGGVRGIAGRIFPSLAFVLKYLSSCLKRAVLGIRSMQKSERLSLFGLIIIFLVLIVIKGREVYLDRTISVPKSGGIYRELNIGQVEYLNPILAKTDTERSISRLIYSGLVKVDQGGNIVPDLAQSWEVSPDGLTYTFHLNSEIYFDNGAEFDSGDVVATVEKIKDPQTKSPYREIWSSVTVAVPDKETVTMELPYPYGPFIYNCIQGVVDSNDAEGSLVGNINGTGAYKIKKIATDKSSKISQIELVAGDSNYLNSVLISEVIIDLAKEAKESFGSLDKYMAVFGTVPDQQNYIKQSFAINRCVALIPNIRGDLLADQGNRDKIFKEGAFNQETPLKLLIQDVESQVSVADNLVEEFSGKNIKLEVLKLSGPEYIKKRQSREFDLLLTGFDFGYDRDPYSYWHTTQLEKENYAGYSDKSSDIALEDARMMLDALERNKRYDQFFDTMREKSLIKFFDPVECNFFVSGELKGMESISASKPEDRFNSIGNWYLKEGRVKK